MPLLIDVKQNVPELPDFDLEFVVEPTEEELKEADEWPPSQDLPHEPEDSYDLDPYDLPSNWSN
jgi:hypothetical protein|tara:strand:- start:1704 stop:1895 length:192 start_codon:yes stop_codon:yes gene_type:complete